MRDQSKLHPILQYKIKQLIALCEAHDLKIGIGECVRTVQEQDALYAKGRTAPGNKVTNCKGSTYSSMHQWGVAFDFYLVMDVDGDGQTSDDTYNDSTGLYTKVGKLGQSIGLEWGGAWKSIVDKPHFQLPYWGSTPSKLKSLYGTPSKFDDTWYPTQPTSTVKAGSSLNDVNWVQNEICKLTDINICIDRHWGNQTSSAVYEYQQMLGWNPTGKAGPKTLAALAKGRIK